MLLPCLSRCIRALFSVPVLGGVWLLLAGQALKAALLPPPHTLLCLSLPDEPQAAWLLAALLALRGALAWLATARYRRWFRLDSDGGDEDNSARVLWLTLCTVAWLSLSHWGDITLPDWLILWGILGWGWLLLPFIDWDNNANHCTNILDDSWSCSPVWDDSHRHPNPDPFDSWRGINPATGLPMMSGLVDTGGNPYGTSTSHTDLSHDISGLNSGH